MSWGAVIAAGGAILGGVISSSGAGDAADTQAGSADAAIREQRLAREEARRELRPFTRLGTEIAPGLLDFVREGPETELERTRGFEDIQRSAAAGGKLRSGGTLESLTTFNNQLNARNRGQRFNELFNLATLGSNAAAGQATATQNFAGNISDMTIGRGDAVAAGQVGRANAAGSTISDLARIFANRGG